MVLDRVANRIESVKADSDQALADFADGNLHMAAEKLRRARENINRSLVTIKTRGQR